MRLPLLFAFCVALLIGVSVDAQTPQKPFVMPVAGAPGPSTWLLGQPYGNTVGAFLRGADWYEAGQRMHFGIDISMKCGTPLVAVADGQIGFVDDRGFGSGPHNLILIHPQLGLTTLYGHLLEEPSIQPGTQVKQGDVIARSGDPDETCDSRPHLHFEVRSLEYTTAYNPVLYIDANWHALTAIGSFSGTLFERDLDNASQWISIDDQPTVTFWGRALNDYAAPFPDYRQGLPPENPPVARAANPLPDRWTPRRLTYEGCCAGAWWGAANRLFVIDGSPGQRAAIFEWNTDEGVPVNLVATAPPPLTSPDGSLLVSRVGDQITIQRAADGAVWTVETENTLPAVSAGNSYLMWERSRPNQPETEVWVSDLDGANPRMIAAERGGYWRWLDDHRLLIGARRNQTTAFAVYDVSDGSSFSLGTYNWLRGLSIAPGGGRLMFYLVNQENEADSGIYTIEIAPDAQAQHLPFFGAWRWRDGDSVFYIPLEADQSTQTLHFYDLVSGEDRLFQTDPFLVANGDWSVSPDGDQIAFWNANDMTLWLLEGS